MALSVFLNLSGPCIHPSDAGERESSYSWAHAECCYSYLYYLPRGEKDIDLT